MSGFSVKTMGSGWPPSFLILESLRATGRKSATAAVITTASAMPASASIAACMSRAETTRTTRAPAGSGSSTFAATTVTSAPRSAAERASAYPCLPVDQFPRKRTGSSSSRVPPAEITTRLPSREAAAGTCLRRARASGGDQPGQERLGDREQLPRLGQPPRASVRAG